MKQEQTLANFLDFQEFFELMQIYRRSDIGATEYEAVKSALKSIAQPEQPAAPVLTMNPMESENGTKGWYIDGPDFYCDIEREPGGGWAVFVRSKDGAEGFAELEYIAQPEQITAEGDAKDAPYEAIASILNEVMEIAVSNGANSISMPGEYVEVAFWLCNQKPRAAIASEKAAHGITATPQGNL